MYGLGDEIQGLNGDVAALRKENSALKNEVASLRILQHCKGKIIAVDCSVDEVTLRVDVGKTSGMSIGSIVAITSPIA